MPYSVKGFFEINEDMVQILLLLEILFTQDSKVEDLFCGEIFVHFKIEKKFIFLFVFFLLFFE